MPTPSLRQINIFLKITGMKLRIFFMVAMIAILPELAKAQKVMVNKNGNKYHLQDCRYARDASAVDVQDALKNSYVPCEVCKPPAKANGAGVQCKGKNKDGARCSRKTTNRNGLCWQHG
jgi:hypothetical protein